MPNAVDLNDWLLENAPEAYEALKYVSNMDAWYEAALEIYQGSISS